MFTTRERYPDILREHAVPSEQRLIGHNFILQHDNKPKHSSEVVKKYFEELTEEEILEVMILPPQSPDLNTIERVWEYLDRTKNERQPKSIHECIRVLQTVCATIPNEFILKLYQIAAVRNAMGDHTKY